MKNEKETREEIRTNIPPIHFGLSNIVAQPFTRCFFILQHFHRLFLPETKTANSRASENYERTGHGWHFEERVASI